MAFKLTIKSKKKFIVIDLTVDDGEVTPIEEEKYVFCCYLWMYILLLLLFSIINFLLT